MSNADPPKRDMVKCPAKGCNVEIHRLDFEAQFHHMSDNLSDPAHNDVMTERLKGIVRTDAI